MSAENVKTPAMVCPHTPGYACSRCQPEMFRDITVPSSEHQRLEAACARYREVLEEMLVSEIQDDPDDESVRIRWCFDCDTGAENGVITHAPDCLLSSDAGAPLLERVERAESMLDGAWREYDRVKTERDAASAESADLRARLERAGGDLLAIRNALRDAGAPDGVGSMLSHRVLSLPERVQWLAAEVRRAVEEEREACAKIAEGWLSGSKSCAEHIRSRSRGGA